MKFILENFQIVIVIGFVLATIVKQVLEKKQQQQQELPWEPEEGDERAGDSRETAGPPALPQVKVPPPLPQRRTMVADAAELERQQKLQERLKALRDSKTPAAPAKAARKARPVTPALISPSKLKASLRNRGELRRAIVLREILGPPVGLK